MVCRAHSAALQLVTVYQKDAVISLVEGVDVAERVAVAAAAAAVFALD